MKDRELSVLILGLSLAGLWACSPQRGAAGRLSSHALSGPSVETKMLALDATSGDQFGFAVAISGDTAVVGAYYDDDMGTTSGSAYIFTRSGAVWSQQQKLTATDGVAGDQFGKSVAISGNTVVVGAPKNDDGGADAGAAYVFALSGDTWSLQEKLLASDGAKGDNFGWSVGVSDDTVVVGAYLDKDKNTAIGSAYVFVRNGTAWDEQQKLLPSDGAADDQFGRAVAISGETAVVGAPSHDAQDSNAGAIYVFVRTSTSWNEQQKLTAQDGASGDQLGFSLALEGDTLLAGAPYDNTADANDGSAYVFVYSGGSWSQQQKLNASDPAWNDVFGFSVGLSGEAIVVGAAQHDDNGVDSGSAYVFTRSGGTWSQHEKLLASDGVSMDWFGIAVAIGGDTVIVGASFGNAPGVTDSGSAYVYTYGAGPPVDSTVDSSEDAAPLADSTVDTTSPADSSVDITPPADSSVDITPSADSSVDTMPPADSAVDTMPPADSAVDITPPADSSNDSAAPADSSNDTAAPADSGLDTAPAADTGVDTAILYDASVDTAILSDTGVDTAILSDTGVDTAILSDAGVDTAILSDASVDTAILSDASVDTATLSDSSADGAESKSTTSEGCSCALNDRSPPVVQLPAILLAVFIFCLFRRRI